MKSCNNVKYFIIYTITSELFHVYSHLFTICVERPLEYSVAAYFFADSIGSYEQNKVNNGIEHTDGCGQ